MTTPWPTALACSGCATELGPMMKACPACGRLVHADALTQLATTARAAADRGDLSAALSAWREALDLLPPTSRQHQVIADRITALGRAMPTSAGSATVGKAADERSFLSRLGAGLGAVGLAAWKAKALLLGLTKGTTLLTMLLSFGVYWTRWGWKFALGLVLSIYVHEMGHVFALRRYGFKATAPMFVPGLGAVIRLQQQVVSPQEDADIGLAGPIYGLGAAIASLALWGITGLPIFAAIGGVGAWINLFNLLPVWTLDGGRAFHALSRPQRFAMAVLAGACWYATDDGMLILIGIVCAARSFTTQTGTVRSGRTAITFAALLIALTAVSTARHAAGAAR